MLKPPTILRILVCVLLVLAGVSLRCGLHVENSLTDLLPGKGDAATVAFERLARTGARQVNALFRADNPDAARAAAQKAAETLPAEVKVVMPEGSMREVADALSPYRFQLLSARHRGMLEAGKVEELREEALVNLYSFVPLLLLSADEDPYGFTTSFMLENPALTVSGLAPDGGVLMGELDGAHYACLPLLLPEECAGSPTQLDDVMRKVALACGLEEDGTAAGDGPVRAMLAGVPVHTWLASRESMTAMSALGVVSTLMVVGLFLLVFHSLRGLFIMVVTLACGGLMAVGAVAAVFGNVHLLALVFACSLVGLSTDYMVHYLVAHGREKGAAAGTMDSGFPRGLTRALLAGFTSTALGYLLFCFSDMALLNQIALLSLTGLGGVVLVMFAFYPWLFLKHVPVRLGTAACRAGRFLGAHSCPRWVPWGVVALCAVPCLGLHTNDDLRSFYTPPPHLLEAERAMALLNNQKDGVLCLLVQGRDAADVLAREEALVETLRANGMACRAVSSFVPSPERQKKDFDLVQPVVASGTEDLAVSSAPVWNGPMTPQHLFRASGTFALLEPLWGGTSSLVLVTGGERGKLEALIAGRDDVLLVDRFGDLAAGMKAYRLRLLLFLALVLLPAWGILALRQGAWRALVLMGPVVGGVAVVPCVLALTGTGLTLFHVLGGFLVVGLGFDYVVFRSEQAQEENLGLAVSLSFLTTLIAFGVLAFTTFSVTRDIGVTISLGLSVTYLLSFAATPRPKGRACTASCAEGKC